MTGSGAKSTQKRLYRSALKTTRWANNTGNLREIRRNRLKTSTTAIGTTTELENNGKIRQSNPKTKLLGKCRPTCYPSLHGQQA